MKKLLKKLAHFNLWLDTFNSKSRMVVLLLAYFFLFTFFGFWFTIIVGCGYAAMRFWWAVGDIRECL